MKKVLTFMVLLASLLFVQQANAQVKFGLKGGLNVTNMSFSKDVFDASLIVWKGYALLQKLRQRKNWKRSADCFMSQ